MRPMDRTRYKDVYGTESGKFRPLTTEHSESQHTFQHVLELD